MPGDGSPAVPRVPCHVLPASLVLPHIPLGTRDWAFTSPSPGRTGGRGGTPNPSSSLGVRWEPSLCRSHLLHPSEPESSGREKYPLTSRLCSPGLTRWIISRNPSFPWLLLHFSFCSFSSPLPFFPLLFFSFFKQKTFLATVIATESCCKAGTGIYHFYLAGSDNK